MANEKAWKDVKDLERHLRVMKAELRNFQETFNQFERLKQAVQSTSSRRVDLSALLALHPTLTFQSIDEEYIKYREVADWLKSHKL